MPNGEYNIEIIDANEYNSFSEILIIGNENKFTSLRETIKIYPNPATDNITIEIYNNLTGKIEYAITDNIGRIRGKGIFVKNQNMIRYSKNLSGLNTGSYNIVFIFDNNKKVSKVLIVK